MDNTSNIKSVTEFMEEFNKTEEELAAKLGVTVNGMKKIIKNPTQTTVKNYRSLMYHFGIHSMDKFYENTEGKTLYNETSHFKWNKSSRIFFCDYIKIKGYNSLSDFINQNHFNRNKIYELVKTKKTVSGEKKRKHIDKDQINKLSMNTFIKIAKCLDLRLDVLYYLMTDGMHPQKATAEKRSFDLDAVDKEIEEKGFDVFFEETFGEEYEKVLQANKKVK